MGQYLPVVALMVLGILFGALSFFASRLLAPRRPSSAKEAPYECGIVPSREPPERFPVGFYLVAMLFVMFDIEIIFIYPYAIAQNELGVFGFVALLVFSGLIFVPFVYEVARGGLAPAGFEHFGLIDYMYSFTGGPGQQTLATTVKVKQLLGTEPLHIVGSIETARENELLEADMWVTGQ